MILCANPPIHVSIVLAPRATRPMMTCLSFARYVPQIYLATDFLSYFLLLSSALTWEYQGKQLPSSLRHIS